MSKENMAYEIKLLRAFMKLKDARIEKLESLLSAYERQMELMDKAIERKDAQFMGLRSAYQDEIINKLLGEGILLARLNDEERKLILADFHTGYFTNRELALKYKVSHVTIGKMVKDLEPKHREKVMQKIAHAVELNGESYQEVTAIEKVVTEKTKYLALINNNATKLADKLSLMADQIDTAQDLKTLVDANDRLAITLKVADRHAPKVEVNNTNAQQNNQKVIKVEYE